METEFHMSKLFGSFLADGDAGNRFRFCEVESALGMGNVVVFDFEGVTNMTDSFSNACFGNLFADHPEADNGLNIHFKNCSPVVKMFLQRAIGVGRSRRQHA
ncbi:MAG: STAS-like domain-containing protein [Verrucomicrobiae bacterium]|nr:STAS-like domain-containing protein [Verrucomicrobiae bacterium]